MSRLRSTLLFAVVVLVVFTAGCTGILGGTDSPGEQLHQEVDETEPPETFSATVETSVTTDGENGSETESITENIWLRDDGTSRTEGGGETGSADDGTYVVVNDGERVWQQDHETGSVTRYEIQASDQSRLERIYDEQRRYFDRFDVQSVEEAAVDGRESHRVVFEPPQNETLERSIDIMVDETTYRIPLETSVEEAEDEHAETIEIWFDEETLFPLQYRMKADTTEFTVSYEDVSFGESFDDEQFEFEPPVGAEPEELEFPAIDYYDSVEGIDEAVDIDVREPASETLRSEFVLDSIQGTTYPDEERTQATLFYRDDSDRSIQVAVADGSREYPVQGSSVGIDGVQATIGETEAGTELEWEHEGQYYHLFGDEELEEETLLEIAGSLHE